MNPEPSEDPESVGIDQLQGLGLSAYAARTFVALVGMGGGTARAVSDNSDVPRTRVYDAIDELKDRGMVDVQQTSPKRFVAVSTETTARRFEREYRERIDRLTAALEMLETDPRSEAQRGVWTVTGRERVTDRVLSFLAGAEDEIIYMSVDHLLTEDVLDELAAASERGVDISLAEMAGESSADLADALPDAREFESLWDWSDDPAGRLLLVDRSKTLVSVLVENGLARDPERDETAIWGSGNSNSLVVVLRAMFTWQQESESG
jgi:sugar-specific transcriptional regulator TrmB